MHLLVLQKFDLINILKPLQPKDLASCGQVSHAWYSVSCALWKLLTHRVFNNEELVRQNGESEGKTRDLHLSGLSANELAIGKLFNRTLQISPSQANVLNSSQIRTIHSLDEIFTLAISKKTLIMFDLDDVLIYPHDALLQNWRSGWKPEGIRAWTAKEDTLAWMNARFKIMDPFGPELIDILNENEIPTIGFTSFAMDQADIVKSIPEWRSKHLSELGLYFRDKGEFVFSAQKEFVPPSFEKGVLYCGNIHKKDKDNKGKIFSLYLDWLDWTPEQVLLIDDGKQNLDSVGNELARRHIPFHGFLYIPKILDSINEKVAALQYLTVINQSQWLSDREAKKLLHSYLWLLYAQKKGASCDNNIS